jgi:predicted metal-binding membrane protein
MLMTVAMMVPAALPIVQEIGLHSLWSRRYRAGLIFIAAYVSVWALFGTAAITLWRMITPSEPDVGLVSGILVLTAAGWALTSAKRRHLKRCHRLPPLPSEERAANKALLRFGVYHARQCIGVCWPLMLLMIPAHTLLSMAGIAALSSWERLARLPRLRVCALILTIVGTGILIAS